MILLFFLIYWHLFYAPFLFLRKKRKIVGEYFFQTIVFLFVIWHNKRVKSFVKYFLKHLLIRFQCVIIKKVMSNYIRDCSPLTNSFKIICIHAYLRYIIPFVLSIIKHKQISCCYNRIKNIYHNFRIFQVMKNQGVNALLYSAYLIKQFNAYNF